MLYDRNETMNQTTEMRKETTWMGRGTTESVIHTLCNSLFETLEGTSLFDLQIHFSQVS